MRCVCAMYLSVCRRQGVVVCFPPLLHSSFCLLHILQPNSCYFIIHLQLLKTAASQREREREHRPGVSVSRTQVLRGRLRAEGNISQLAKLTNSSHPIPNGAQKRIDQCTHTHMPGAETGSNVTLLGVILLPSVLNFFLGRALTS